MSQTIRSMRRGERTRATHGLEAVRIRVAVALLWLAWLLLSVPLFSSVFSVFSCRDWSERHEQMPHRSHGSPRASHSSSHKRECRGFFCAATLGSRKLFAGCFGCLWRCAGTSASWINPSVVTTAEDYVRHSAQRRTQVCRETPCCSDLLPRCARHPMGTDYTRSRHLMKHGHRTFVGTCLLLDVSKKSTLS